MRACLGRHTQVSRGNRVRLLRHGSIRRSTCIWRLRHCEGGQNKQREDQVGRRGFLFNDKPTKLIYFLVIPTALRTLIGDPKTARPGTRGHFAASWLLHQVPPTSSSIL